MKRRRTNEGQPVQRGENHRDPARAGGGAKTQEVCRCHGISGATFYIYLLTAPPWQEGPGSGLAVIDCKHLFGVTR
jgi:hypothetical protein